MVRFTFGQRNSWNTLGAIALEHLAREKQRRTRYVRHLKSRAVENAVDVLDAHKGPQRTLHTPRH
jgi:hypothetical protein